MNRLVGITNPTHVACHISTALWMLYAIEPLRTAIIFVSQSLHASAVVLELGRFFEMIGNQGDVGDERMPVDPIRLYRQLRYNGIVDSNRTGDAVTTLSKLVAFLRDDDLLVQVVGPLLFSGKMESVLRGKKNNETRTKTLPVKTLPCPWTIPIAVGATSNTEAAAIPLAQVCAETMEEKQVKDYLWKSSDDSPGDGDIDWHTTKCKSIEKLPPIVMLHFDVGLEGSWIDAPQQLSGSEICPSDHHQYQLQGGIILLNQTSDSASQDSDDEIHGEHVVALLRMNEENSWCLLDDEIVKKLSGEEAIEICKGQDLSCRANLASEESHHARMVLALYKREDGLTHSTTDVIRRQASLIDWNDPHSLLEKRLRIQWSKGKWYSGRVSNFENGKHEVTYDDGDVKWYKLSNRVLEWEQPQKLDILS